MIHPRVQAIGEKEEAVQVIQADCYRGLGSKCPVSLIIRLKNSVFVLESPALSEAKSLE
jgi:hypothetical protein